MINKDINICFTDDNFIRYVVDEINVEHDSAHSVENIEVFDILIGYTSITFYVKFKDSRSYYLKYGYKRAV